MKLMKAVIKEKPYPGKEWHKGFKVVQKPIPEIQNPDEVNGCWYLQRKGFT
jgi:hypothetical protein